MRTLKNDPQSTYLQTIHRNIGNLFKQGKPLNKMFSSKLGSRCRHKMENKGNEQIITFRAVFQRLVRNWLRATKRSCIQAKLAKVHHKTFSLI